MASAQKDTIYIDIDDEITAVIEKVKDSPHKIVALVLPKRATVFQSIVNMKLLKRTATTAKKNLVLITSEQNLLPMAGAVGLHVAKNLQTKPSIPPPPDVPDQLETVDEPVASGAPELDPSKSIGELATAAGASLPDTGEESIEVDNVEAASEAAKKPSKKATKGAAGKKLKIPDFIRFRKRLFIGGGLVLLFLISWFMAFWIMPKATIRVITNTDELAASATITADTAAKELNLENNVVPAALAETDNEASEKVAATGEKNEGNQASGVVRLTNCSEDNTSITVPAGTGVSANGQTYITAEAVDLPFSGSRPNGSCDSASGITSGTTSVTAQNPGAAYNTGSTSLAVSGYSSVQATTDGISGGTDKIVKVVAQKDVNAATERLENKAEEEVKAELKAALEQQGLLALTDTFKAEKPAITASPKVGDEAAEVTVTAKTEYSMLGVNRDDLAKLIENSVKDQVDTSRQSILDTGLDDAVYRIEKRDSAGKAQVLVQSTVTAGPQIDIEQVRKDMAGKKRGEIEQTLSDLPGVEDVIVEYSPFWVYSTPKSANKINVVIEDSGE